MFDEMFDKHPFLVSAAVIGFIAAVITWIHLDNKQIEDEWEKFLADHHCVKTAHTDRHFVPNHGKYRSHYESATDTFHCDDGVDYNRDSLIQDTKE